MIFVALAVAWAVYLVPKALKHHDEVVRSRSVDRFSHTMRVLARREPVEPAQRPPGRHPRAARVGARGDREAVAAPRRPALGPRPGARPPSRAAARRRNVLAVLLLATLVVVGLAALRRARLGVDGRSRRGLLVAWLVACRLMVKQERTVRVPRPASARRTAPGEQAAPVAEPVRRHAGRPGRRDRGARRLRGHLLDAGRAGRRRVDPALWDPVPVTLPTYVSKPAAARRTVRTIDLDDSGVWTLGPHRGRRRDRARGRRRRPGRAHPPRRRPGPPRRRLLRAIGERPRSGC